MILPRDREVRRTCTASTIVVPQSYFNQQMKGCCHGGCVQDAPVRSRFEVQLTAGVRLAYLRDHRLLARSLLPATAFLESAFAAVRLANLWVSLQLNQVIMHNNIRTYLKRVHVCVFLNIDTGTHGLTLSAVWLGATGTRRGRCCW